MEGQLATWEEVLKEALLKSRSQRNHTHTVCFRSKNLRSAICPSTLLHKFINLLCKISTSVMFSNLNFIFPLEISSPHSPGLAPGQPD